MPADLVLTGALVALGLAIGFALGRKTGSAARRVGDLQARLEDVSKQRERLVAEVAAGKEAVARTREEFATYRGQVGEHFTGTSDLLRDLTHQYRAVYEHLTKGAGALCPEGFERLREGLAPDALPSGEAQAPPDAPAAETSSDGDDGDSR